MWKTKRRPGGHREVVEPCVGAKGHRASHQNHLFSRAGRTTAWLTSPRASQIYWRNSWLEKCAPPILRKFLPVSPEIIEDNLMAVTTNEAKVKKALLNLDERDCGLDEISTRLLTSETVNWHAHAPYFSLSGVRQVKLLKGESQRCSMSKQVSLRAAGSPSC